MYRFDPDLGLCDLADYSHALTLTCKIWSVNWNFSDLQRVDEGAIAIGSPESLDRADDKLPSLSLSRSSVNNRRASYDSPQDRQPSSHIGNYQHASPERYKYDPETFRNTQEEHLKPTHVLHGMFDGLGYPHGSGILDSVPSLWSYCINRLRSCASYKCLTSLLVIICLPKIYGSCDTYEYTEYRASVWHQASWG